MRRRRLSPRQYVLQSVMAYPAIYNGKCYDDVAVRVFDQLFNVNGNGIRDSKELAKQVRGFPIDEAEAEKYLKGEPIFWGYEKVKKIGDTDLPIGPSSVVALDCEKHLHPNIKYWLKNTRYDWTPYPNFKEDYSIIYRSNFLTYGDEWLKAAILFYEQAYAFFMEHPQRYLYAFPCATENETKRRTKDMEEMLKKYSSFEEISEAYECEFNGDVVDFQTRRWNKELERILKFIVNTIDLLKSNLKDKQ